MTRDRSVWGALVVVVVVACGLLALAWANGQVSTVLSTVGHSVDTPDDRSAPDSPTDESNDSDGVTAGEVIDAAAVADAARVVRTGSLELVVDATTRAADRAAGVVEAAGGYVGESHISNGDRPTARIAFRIPSQRWDATLGQLRAIGEVVGEETAAVDVGGQLVDLAARIDNLRAAELALQGIAAQATAIDDVLKIQARLTDVRGQIEQLAAQEAHLDDQASFGTLEVTLGVEVVAVVAAAEGWDPAGEVDRAAGTLVDILQAAATAGIWAGIVWLPVLVALAVVAAAGAFVVRRVRGLAPG